MWKRWAWPSTMRNAARSWCVTLSNGRWVFWCTRSRKPTSRHLGTFAGDRNQDGPMDWLPERLQDHVPVVHGEYLVRAWRTLRFFLVHFKHVIRQFAAVGGYSNRSMTREWFTGDTRFSWLLQRLCGLGWIFSCSCLGLGDAVLHSLSHSAVEFWSQSELQWCHRSC